MYYQKFTPYITPNILKRSPPLQKIYYRYIPKVFHGIT